MEPRHYIFYNLQFFFFYEPSTFFSDPRHFTRDPRHFTLDPRPSTLDQNPNSSVLSVAWNIANQVLLSVLKHVGTLVPFNNKISTGLCSDKFLVPQDLRKCLPISVKLRLCWVMSQLSCLCQRKLLSPSVFCNKYKLATIMYKRTLIQTIKQIPLTVQHSSVLLSVCELSINSAFAHPLKH